MLTAYFYHKTTGLPLTDPAVTVSVLLANMNNDTIVLNNVTMTASTSFPGAFRHTYAIDTEIDYMAYYSCSNSNYIASVDKLFIQARGGGGGGGVSVNYGAINGHVTKKINELDEKVMKELKLLKGNDKAIYDKINETDSHIELAKDDVISTIGSIEKSDEKEAKKAVKLLTTLDKKVKSYIDSEMKEKDDTSAIIRELNKLDIEDEIKMKEKKQKEEEEKKMEEIENKKEEERIAKLLNDEFDKLEEQDKVEKKKELEKELQEAKKEVTEIEIELKSL